LGLSGSNQFTWDSILCPEHERLEMLNSRAAVCKVRVSYHLVSNTQAFGQGNRSCRVCGGIAEECLCVQIKLTQHRKC
jgi:hypothetical protein